MSTLARIVSTRPRTTSHGRFIGAAGSRALLLLMLKARQRSAYAASSTTTTTTAREQNPIRQSEVPWCRPSPQLSSCYGVDVNVFRRYSHHKAAGCGFQFYQERRNGDRKDPLRLPWGTQVIAGIQTTSKGTGTSNETEDREEPQKNEEQEMVDQNTPGVRPPGRLAKMRNRLQKAGEEATEDAKDWIREKRDDIEEMTETLRDAQKEGRLRKEITDQAKEGTGKVRVLWNKYGFVAIGTYFCIYVTTLLSCFVFYDSGLVTTMPAGTETIIENLKGWLKFMPEEMQHYTDQLLDAVATNERARSLVLAWATCKMTEPLRVVLTLAVTPRVARALGRAPPQEAAREDQSPEKEEEDSKRL